METINLLHEVTNVMKQLKNEHAEMRNQIVTLKAQLDQVIQTMNHEKECREALQEKLEELKERLDKVESELQEESHEDLASPIAIIKCFVAQKCEITKDKKDEIFAKDLWDVFVEWKNALTLVHVKHVKQHSLYKHIDGLTEYNNKGKVLINNERTTGWYGIKLK